MHLAKNSLIIILLIFFSYYGFSQTEAIDEIVAVVGGNIILKSDIENEYIQYKQQDLSANSDLKCEILEKFLYQKLLINQAEFDSIEVTLKEVENIIDRKMTQFIQQAGSAEALEEYFGKSVEEMKEALKEAERDNLLAERMQNELIGDVKVTPSEVRDFFKSIPKDSLPLINAELEFEQIVKQPVITESQKLATIEYLRELREEVIAGADFGMKAVLYSEDPGSASNKGNLGFMSRTELVPEFTAVAFNLKPGEISKVVETEFGYHLIKVLEKKGELINVSHILRIPKVSENELQKAKLFIDSVVQLVRLDSLTFGEAATKFSDDEDSKNNGGLAVNPYTQTSRFEADQLDGATYYALKNLKPGQMSANFQTVTLQGKKVYKVVRLRSNTKAHTANLKDDYQRIQEIALMNSKQVILNKWMEKKQESTYIRIDPSYKNCNFNMKGWIK